MESSSPARLYCLLFGAALVIAGLIGFFYEASFSTGDEVVSDEAFGLLAVNGWHNVIHMASGAILLIGAGGIERGMAAAFGVIYLAVAFAGFATDSGVLLEVIPVNDEDNFLHLVLGLTGLLAAFASRRPASRPAAA